VNDKPRSIETTPTHEAVVGMYLQVYEHAGTAGSEAMAKRALINYGRALDCLNGMPLTTQLAEVHAPIGAILIED